MANDYLRHPPGYEEWPADEQKNWDEQQARHEAPDPLPEDAPGPAPVNHGE